MPTVNVMPSFMGEHSHNIDKKGRIILPAKFREDFGDSVVVTRGLDGCLKVYTATKFAEVRNRIEALPMTKREARDFARYLLGGSCNCEFDAQGRILIPANLIKFATLEKNCIVIGCGDSVEIWSETRWNDYSESVSGKMESIAEQLTDLML